MPTPTEIAQWHRYFAVECNNAAWDLTALPDRTPEQNDALLAQAHAAAFHWKQVGQPINNQRAWMLLAHAHALLGQPEQALDYARRGLDFCSQFPEQCTPWDIAFAHLEMALASAVAGNAEDHAQYYALAASLIDSLSEKNQPLFREELARVPSPGGGEIAS